MSLIKSQMRSTSLVLFALLSAASHADNFGMWPGHGNPGNPGHGHPPGGPGGPGNPYPPPGGYCQALNQGFIDLNRWVQGDTTLQIRQLLNLGSGCSGLQVERVYIYAASDRRGWDGQATLYVNNQPQGYTQTIPSNGVNQFSFEPDRYRNQLDRDIQTLDLFVRGTVYIQRVGVVLSQGQGNPYPNPNPNPYPNPNPNPYPQPQPQPQPQPGGSVSLGVLGFSGQGVQSMVLSVGQAGYLLEIDLFSKYAATNITSLSVVFANGEVVNYSPMIIPQQGTARIQLTHPYGGQVGGYVREIRATAGTASQPAYGVYMDVTGIQAR